MKLTANHQAISVPRRPALSSGSSADERLDDLVATIRALERWGARRDWLGSDPYEGLNARRLHFLKHRALARRALIQLVKRSPIDMRGLLGIESVHNPAALGHVLSAYARMGSLEGSERKDRIARVVARLEELRCPGYLEPCWAYPFDVETRFFFYSRTTPNTIATAFVGLGLLDAHTAVGDPRLLELAEGAGDFFLRHVPQTPAGDGRGAFFGYFPGDRTPIHNASLLAGGLLARLGSALGREDFRDAARAGADYALERQRPDGSWPYAERANLDWIDNFHTGYVLDSLFRRASTLDGGEIRSAYERGLRFYAERLFLDDGTPKYFVDRVYPIDAQCVAQAIHTFALAATLDAGWLDQAWRVYGFAVARMRRADGAFMFQRGRLWVNSAPHIRWVQAPMLDALTLLLRVTARLREG